MIVSTTILYFILTFVCFLFSKIEENRNSLGFDDHLFERGAYFIKEIARSFVLAF